MNSAFRLPRSLLVGSLLYGCGTQIGNPTGAKASLATVEPESLATLVNAAFMQSLDAINAGDYFYSSQESRVSTERLCEQSVGRPYSLTDRAVSSHSVADENQEWLIQSQVKIQRDYQDAWTQNSLMLACNPQNNSVKFDPKRLVNGPYRLASKIQEEYSRELKLTNKSSAQELRHSLSLNRSGTRVTEISDLQEDLQALDLKASVKSDVASEVQLRMADSSLKQVEMRISDATPLDFIVELDKQRIWSRYEIPFGSQEYRFPASGEAIRLDYQGLVFTRSGGCIPTEGRLLVQVTRPNVPLVSYSIDFGPDSNLQLIAANGEERLGLAPFACVLKEK